MRTSRELIMGYLLVIFHSLFWISYGQHPRTGDLTILDRVQVNPVIQLVTEVFFFKMRQGRVRVAERTDPLSRLKQGWLFAGPCWLPLMIFQEPQRSGSNMGENGPAVPGKWNLMEKRQSPRKMLCSSKLYIYSLCLKVLCNQALNFCCQCHPLAR